MSLLFVASLLCFGALVSGQLQECPDNPCGDHSTACFLKPDGVTPYCHCTPNYEGDFCDKFNRQRYSCSVPNRNFYGQKAGNFASQNYPANYPVSQACPYFIGSVDAKKFELTLHDLSFEKGKDELTIGTGSLVDVDGYEYLYDQEVYQTLPETLTLTGDRVWFNFYSDFNRANRGFNISWRIDGDECLDNPCGVGETCVDGEYSYVCQATGTPLILDEVVGEILGGGDVTGGGEVTGSGEVAGGGGRQCNIEGKMYDDGVQWDLTPCSYCTCRDGTGTCEYKQCLPIKCKIPIKKAGVCCHSCPPQRLFVNQVSYSLGSGSGSIISHKSNQIVLRVDVGYDFNRSSAEFYGSNLWKVGMYTKMKAEAGGGEISASEQILDKRKSNKKLENGDKLIFNRLKYNLDLTDRRCEDIEEICAVFDKGDNPNPEFTMVPEPNPDIFTSCQAVNCPPPPQSVTCRDEVNMRDYQDGEQWNPDPCTTCTCHSGHSDCVTLQCPLLDCAETRPVEGECCPQCLVEELGQCVYEGVTRDSGSTWAISDCVNCHCDDGSISCEFFGCQCPATPEELRNCGGYKNGDTWFESNCLQCTCTEGDINCEGIPCTPLNCTEKVQGETDCCPRCKDDPGKEPLPCRQGDKTYYHGQEWKLDDCITCACSNGYTSCAETKCLPLECEDPILTPGECCMACPDQPPNLGKPCSQNGRLYAHGENWEPDPCANCFCDSSQVICAVVACVIPLCPGRIVYDDPTACCPYCEPIQVTSCTQGDVEYPDGHTWNPEPCLSCSCRTGIVDCVATVCEILCLEYVQVPGQCCPECAEVPPLPMTCSYQGQDYVQGETFKEGPCSTCRCNNGTVACSAVSCELIYCEVAHVTPPGECCPICPALFCTDPTTGQRIENRQTYKPDPCTECQCSDGIPICVEVQCHPVEACVNTYIPDGECCAQCADGKN
ncbi:cysteine-rich motor neuron 1 protein-like [Acanthaster planci]|uniref:Cysteine-rich motor neuron 1 protein-like n=1 Tax=Acanthaster planci TaxID=133434 RepID=A0A8B7XQK0_ACAPL|nr:cysteine-rich motor neuron 1 protein-like [Acanthaster planci]